MCRWVSVRVCVSVCKVGCGYGWRAAMGEGVMGVGGDVVRLFFRVPHSDLTHDQQVNKRERDYRAK